MVDRTRYSSPSYGEGESDSTKMAQSRQNIYTKVKRRPLELEVDVWVYLKVSPMKGVMRFVKKGKLIPRYIGPYRISKRVGNVAYELELHQELGAVHPVFHTSMLKKCLGDPSLVIPIENVGVKDNLSYEKVLVQILDHQVRKLELRKLHQSSSLRETNSLRKRFRKLRRI